MLLQFGAPAETTRGEMEDRIWTGLRILGFLVFLIGCLAQGGAYLSLYLKYPTAVEVNVTQVPHLDFPAVTVCNSNRVRLKEWCKRDPTVCKTSSESETDYVKRLDSAYKKLDRTTRMDLGHQLEKFIVYCQYEEKDCSEWIARFYDYEYGNCYTVLASWGPQEVKRASATLFRPETGASSELILFMNLESKEYSPLDRTVRARMTIHSQDSIPNPLYDAVSLQPGKYYSYGVAKVTVIVLPAPYSTNCRNYSSEREERVNAAMTQENCLAECSAKSTVKMCGCTYRRLAMLYSVPTCGAEKEDCLSRSREEVKKICNPNCRMSCTKTTYSYDVVDSHSVHKVACFAGSKVPKQLLKYADGRSNVSCVKVFYVTAKNTIYNYRPNYQLIEVFSLLGGYSGLWLGVSLLTICNFLIDAGLYLNKRLRDRKRSAKIKKAIMRGNSSRNYQ